MTRIGLLGGTFDPPHLGHLVAAETARDVLGLDQVWWLVAGQPWMKGDETPVEHRLAMAQAAVAGDDAMVVDDREARRDGPTYTADTLAELREEHPGAAWTFLLGTDAAASLPQWERIEQAIELADWAVVSRPGAPWPDHVLADRLAACPDPAARDLLHRPAGPGRRGTLHPVPGPRRRARPHPGARPVPSRRCLSPSTTTLPSTTRPRPRTSPVGAPTTGRRRIRNLVGGGPTATPRGAGASGAQRTGHRVHVAAPRRRAGRRCGWACGPSVWSRWPWRSCGS